jgi:hypothetical protein
LWTFLLVLIIIPNLVHGQPHRRIQTLLTAEEPGELIGHYRSHIDYDDLTGEDYGSFIVTIQAQDREKLIRGYDQKWIGDEFTSNYRGYSLAVMNFRLFIWDCGRDGPRLTLKLGRWTLTGPDGQLVNGSISYRLNGEGQYVELGTYSPVHEQVISELAAVWFNDNWDVLLITIPSSRAQKLKQDIESTDRWIQVRIEPNHEVFGSTNDEKYSLIGFTEAINRLPCSE